MRRLPPQVSPFATTIMLLVAIALVTSMVVVLRRNQDLRSAASTASDRVINSPLLPRNHWQTYGGSVWSMGYPEDWQIVPTPIGGIDFVDPFTNTTYLTEVEPTRPLADLLADYSTGFGITKSEFLFAGYPATKFTSLENGQQDYFISYKDRVIMLSTQYPDDQNVGIMLVTFQFLN